MKSSLSIDATAGGDDDDDLVQQMTAETTDAEPVMRWQQFDWRQVEAAAREASAVPLEISTRDNRLRWVAVSLAHPVEFAQFRNDPRVQYYFQDDGNASVVFSGDRANNDDGDDDDDDAKYVWWIEPEPKRAREARLRQIFGAFVCGDTLPWMEPWTANAYNSATNPVRAMTDAIVACLASVTSGIMIVPAELREPDYICMEREQSSSSSSATTRKRRGTD